jgi:hypothetical protein
MNFVSQARLQLAKRLLGSFHQDAQAAVLKIGTRRGQ